MTTMITEIYDAFRAAGVAEPMAKAAAEAMYKDSQLATKLDLADLKVDLLKWVAGMMVVQTATLAAVVRLLIV